MRHKGVVLAFRPGTDDEQIRRALYAMRQLLEPRFRTIPHEFDAEEEGWPVWYIP